MITDEQLRALYLAVAPFMVECARNRASMLQIELDPAEILGPTGYPPGTGRIVVVIAGGASKATLESAVLLAAQPQ